MHFYFAQCFFLCLDALLACRREKEKCIINVLITKRLSIIAPKFTFVHPIGLMMRHLQFFIIFSGTFIQKFTVCVQSFRTDSWATGN